jgi:sugar lactone lactonase YvrE
MTSKGLVAITACVLASGVALAQNQPPRLPAPPTNPPAPSVQAPADPGYEALIKACKTPPPAGRGRGGGGGAGRAGGAPAQVPGIREYKVEAIPGVIAAGQQWKFLWQEVGNNGDGIVGTDDGALLVAQNDNSKVVKLDGNGKPSVAYSDTHTGGALSMNKKKALFIVERGLRANVTQLAPQRKVLADSYQGEPLDCIGGVINDLTADSKGGVYFTMGGVYYADPKGVVTKYGMTTPNGIVLSADEKTLYATNGPAIAAFDVQPDGSLTNQREFAKLEGPGGGDGSTIDKDGRLYVTTNIGVQVLGPDGKHLGTIPTPRGVITAAFGGKDKKMLYILARGATMADGTEVANAAQVWAIQMIAQGYKGRAK